MSDRPLARRVLEYTETMQQLVPEVTEPADWAPLAAYVAVDDFERVGTFREVHDWPQYAEMLTRWASATESFETTIRRIAEVDDLVYLEIEERHHRAGRVDVVNSLTVFGFDAEARIRHLNVYMQSDAFGPRGASQ